MLLGQHPSLYEVTWTTLGAVVVRIKDLVSICIIDGFSNRGSDTETITARIGLQ
jgi:hypothetical protein